jgi:hypothetical protein
MGILMWLEDHLDSSMEIHSGATMEHLKEILWGRSSAMIQAITKGLLVKVI